MNYRDLMARNAEMRKSFAVGDKVQWDGSGDAHYPRIYKGVIVEMGADVATVEDNGWHAKSGVPYYKLQKVQS